MNAYVSVLDLFSIGIGPSSSHTVGPMRAAADFADRLRYAGELDNIERVRVTLYGSLAATGIGHCTPDAVVVGLAGHAPETCNPALLRGAWRALGDGAAVSLGGRREIRMCSGDIEFAPITVRGRHPNTMTLKAFDAEGQLVRRETYFSVGGGFIEREGTGDSSGDGADPSPTHAVVPFPFTSAAELLELCAAHGQRIDEIAWANECAVRDEPSVVAGVSRIWESMRYCIDAGLGAHGMLPGPLGVPRRAPGLRASLEAAAAAGEASGQLGSPDWVDAYALAINEENACGGRVVTAPTNGAAGTIPAVLLHAVNSRGLDDAGVRRFLLTATAIGSLIAANASISGAEAGCQGEVGSACAMAAGALCDALGGTPEQVENAAEIAMEHNLGLTCDPIGGLVQVPCIERNAIAASKALTAARLAMHGNGFHLVSLDAVIETMRQTGIDMNANYKETSLGGLAVNVVEC